uniref:Uncharacterized protein n=1 Tax=Pseudo-nitzschia australis TaxID=44445 RepID=A0A7S4ENU0_9STRA|mmetsp:Transcript_1942/g.4268  ORF Transcript_1942/g.4268 Transcript_1942/m.4268 type:complete len:117 (+) Transcript_1942:54-404(+)|eukprot:CAMPEP_0168193268 /NCGR_PEP_ID=MMETSP0139_2-20121125/18509_1 /TAXON_ID=44445 /ORGANISM="Pseudo-nitzschia australis, Strain 10249 10 AB" /LENGTH=116 /DNA_ID=CAMNT_0008116599 /DNA_START=8 /DNA_END=358 /DNA_ORIENTATION=-
MTILYEDKYVTLTEHMLTLKTYYCPSGAPKPIPRKDIERIWLGTDRDIGLNFFKKKGWGLGWSDVWWACRLGREFDGDDTKNFVITTKEKTNFRSGFSVTDPKAFASLIEEYIKKE